MLAWPDATAYRDPSKTHSSGDNIAVNLNHQGADRMKWTPKAMSSAASALNFLLTCSPNEDRILVNVKWVLKILSGFAVSFFFQNYFPPLFFSKSVFNSSPIHATIVPVPMKSMQNQIARARGGNILNSLDNKFCTGPNTASLFFLHKHTHNYVKD